MCQELSQLFDIVWISFNIYHSGIVRLSQVIIEETSFQVN